MVLTLIVNEFLFLKIRPKIHLPPVSKVRHLNKEKAKASLARWLKMGSTGPKKGNIGGGIHPFLEKED